MQEIPDENKNNREYFKKLPKINSKHNLESKTKY